MEFIKEAFSLQKDSGKAYRYVIRTNTYGHSLAYFKSLDHEIYRDFAERRPAEDDLEIVHYGGTIYRFTYGIEFDLAGPKHPDYNEVTSLETYL